MCHLVLKPGERRIRNRRTQTRGKILKTTEKQLIEGAQLLNGYALAAQEKWGGQSHNSHPETA